jgi:hypothetical protein
MKGKGRGSSDAGGGYWGMEQSTGATSANQSVVGVKFVKRSELARFILGGMRGLILWCLSNAPN